MSIKKLILQALKIYMKFISPFLGDHCRFYPTCSDYSYQVIEQFGIIKGGYLTTRRLLRCHPWHSGGFDPAPMPPYTKDNQIKQIKES